MQTETATTCTADQIQHRIYEQLRFPATGRCDFTKTRIAGTDFPHTLSNVLFRRPTPPCYATSTSRTHKIRTVVSHLTSSRIHYFVISDWRHLKVTWRWVGLQWYQFVPSFVVSICCATDWLYERQLIQQLHNQDNNHMSFYCLHLTCFGHYFIPLLAASLRMVMERPEHVGGTF